MRVSLAFKKGGAGRKYTWDFSPGRKSPYLDKSLELAAMKNIRELTKNEKLKRTFNRPF